MFKKKSVCLHALILMGISMNANSTNNSQNNAQDWGRVQTSAAAISGGLLGVFGGDAMIPLYGNQDQMIFGDVMGDYATDDTYSISPGAGFRKVYNNQIFGAYLFGDYQQTSLTEQFWDLSPGIEWMNNRWDAHVNGYFPLETKQQDGSNFFLSTTGDESQVSFETGTHNQYDELVTPYAVIGNGVDAAIGYSFEGLKPNLRSRVYVGGYYYQPPSDDNVDDIPGVTAGFEQPVTNNLKVSIFNSYDQVSDYHVGVSLTMTFGGQSNIFSNDVHTRMLDPVQRHVGIIDTGAGTYDQQTLEDAGTALQYDNIYFVSTTGSDSADGTYGSAMLLDQTSVDAIDTDSPEGSRIYIQGGADANYNINSSTGSTETLNGTPTSGLYVHSNQEFYGRSSDYTTTATSAEQPVITVDGANGYNGFILGESGENVFSDLTIVDTIVHQDNTGILMFNNTADDETLSLVNTSVSGFSRGVLVLNNNIGNITVNTENAVLSDNNKAGGNAGAYGMRVMNTSTGDITINANNSQFNNNVASGNNANSAGLYITNTGAGNVQVNANNSQFNNNSATGTNAISAIGLGVINLGSGNADINISGSQFNGNSVSGNSQSSAIGLYVYNADNGNIDTNVYASSFNDNTANGVGGNAFGLMGVNNGSGSFIVRADSSEFNNNTVSENADRAFGLYAWNNSTGNYLISVTNSEFNSNSSYGFYARNDSTGTMAVTSLYGSSASDNGYYGFYTRAEYPGYMTANLTGISGSGNGLGLTDSNGNVTVVE